MAVTPLFVNATTSTGPTSRSSQLTGYRVPNVVIIGPDSIVRFTAYGYPGNPVVLRELRKVAPTDEKPQY